MVHSQHPIQPAVTEVLLCRGKLGMKEKQLREESENNARGLRNEESRMEAEPGPGTHEVVMARGSPEKPAALACDGETPAGCPRRTLCLAAVTFIRAPHTRRARHAKSGRVLHTPQDCTLLRKQYEWTPWNAMLELQIFFFSFLLSVLSVFAHGVWSSVIKCIHS